jgi:hypothetical protein
MIKSRVFISCGQHGSGDDPTSELGVATIVKRRLEELGFEVYIALEQHTLNGFTENILPALQESEYYLFIDFNREKIITESENERYDIEFKYRGSLFSHQELGIATFLKKEHTLVFQEKGVLEKDGIKGFVQANPITFDNRRILPNKIIDVITTEQWHTGWRNRILMEREEDEHEDTFYVPTGSDARFFHIRVTNNHNLKTAHDCSVYLNSITDLNDRTVRRPPVVEFKWQGMKTKSVKILPNQTRCFDAFFVEKHIPNIIHLGINPFLLDFSGFYQPYNITGPGEYELEFELDSREFQSLRITFSLHIGTNLDDLRLSIRQ